MGTRRRTPDGNGDGNGDGSEDCSGDGNGDDDNGIENRIGEGGREAKKRKKPQNSSRRRARNGGETLLPSSLSALFRRVGLLMPPPGRLNDSTASPRRERQTARGLPTTEPSVLQVRRQQECSNHTRESTCTHTHRHTRNCHGFIQKFQTHYGATNRPFFKNITNRQRHFHTSTSQHAVRTCKYNF